MKDDPIRIALLTCTSGSIGGADRDWINLANAFEPQEAELIWVGTNGTEVIRPHVRSDVVKYLIDAHYPLFLYLIQEDAFRPRSSWLWAKIITDHLLRLTKPSLKLSRLLRSYNVDLVVSNTAMVTAGAIVSQILGKPHIWSIRECLETSRRPCRYLCQLIELFSHSITVPSLAAGKSFCQAEVVVDGSSVSSIRTAAQHYSRHEFCRAMGLQETLPIVAQVSGVSWWKGHHITADAIAALAKEYTTSPCSFLFLGPTRADSDYGRELQRKIKALPDHWQRAVRFHQFSSGDLSAVAAADIVVHPSILPDPLPNSVREAMTLGKPVIGSNSGGIPEMIVDGQSGLLFEPGNASELAISIQKMIESPDERRRLGENAARRAEELFDVRHNKQAFLHLFHAVVSRHAERCE